MSNLYFELSSNSWSGRKRPSPVGISTATPDRLDEWFHHATDDTPLGLGYKTLVSKQLSENCLMT